ncbi:Protein LSM14-like protein B, partial [Armadillidium vulgare]
VQSFGTEDRPAELVVPAKNDIYEYIIFRGTDIKKIEVCDTKPQIPSLHNDPAIVGLQVQQHSASSIATSYPGATFSHQQPLGAIGSMGSYYSSYSQPIGGQQNLPSSGFSIGVSQPNVLAGSRSSTPGVSRKSPVADAGVQVTPPQQQQQIDKKRQMQSVQRRQQTPERQQMRDGNQGPGNYNRRNQYQNQYGQHQQGSRYNQGNQGYYQNMGNQQYQGQYRGGGTNRGRAPRRSQPRGGGGGRGGSYNQGNRQRQDQQLFEKEFDFEQANEEFEELRHQMANTKISENGPAERKVDDKKDDSGHETATTGDESEDSSSSSAYYDKTKSFFDSISCEALERSKGKSQRSDWRQERKINVQTFGVATARRGYYPRGGRGGYYNRGGYYRNYNQGYYSYRNSRGGGGMNPGGLGNRPIGNTYTGGGGGGGGGGGVGSSNNPSNSNDTDNLNHYGTGVSNGPTASYAVPVESYRIGWFGWQ